ncbi:MAG TPA: hypothetical protein EYG58_05845 [Nitrospirales bacterium]|nr:hypothetical protein [Nitrospirales bacterium]
MTTTPPHNLHPKDLLLSPSLTSEQVTTLLTSYGFNNPKQADANLQLMASEPRSRLLLAESIDEILTLLSLSADPDVALNYLERFAKATIDTVHLYTFLKAYPVAVELLATTVGSSPFMSQILIRHPTYFYWLCDPEILHRERTKKDLMRECAAVVNAIETEEGKLNALRRFKRKEVLRIGVKDLLKLTSVRQTTAALSMLAEVLIHHVYEICSRRLRARHGRPHHRNNIGRAVPTGFTVMAMGKLGGKELNFSSDVDLMYVFGSADGITSSSSGRTPILQTSHTEYFRELAQTITNALSEVAQGGYLFRVDLNLRPEGKGGEIATSLDTYQHYYATRGETWERMALLKARPIAGDRTLGRRFLSTIATFVHDPLFGLAELEEVKTIKARINKKLATKSPGLRNVKLGIGGIREVEFIVQSLQLAYGSTHQGLHDRHTINALRKLHHHKLISQRDYGHLLAAYIFFRNVEHKLQMVEDRQTHTLPTNPRDFQRCALMMGYYDSEESHAAEQLRHDDDMHAGHVNEIFRNLVLPTHGTVLERGN